MKGNYLTRPLFDNMITIEPVEKWSDFQPFLQNQARWRNDSLVWTREINPTTALQQQDFFQHLPRTSRYFVILTKDHKNEPLIVGLCGLTGIDQIHRKAEFSLLIGTEHRKKGYGSQALILLLNFGFESLGLNLIFGETFSYPRDFGTNPGAKAYEKLGFKLDGVLRKRYKKYGQWVDALIYSILREEFKKTLT